MPLAWCAVQDSTLRARCSHGTRSVVDFSGGADPWVGQARADAPCERVGGLKRMHQGLESTFALGHPLCVGSVMEQCGCGRGGREGGTAERAGLSRQADGGRDGWRRRRRGGERRCSLAHPNKAPTKPSDRTLDMRPHGGRSCGTDGGGGGGSRRQVPVARHVLWSCCY